MVEIEGTKIEEVVKTKFLGVILKNGLGWKSHISHLSKKIAKTIGILAKARQILNTKSLTQLYYSFMYPYIVYCNVIWGNAPNSHLWQIFKLQKRAIWIITNTKYRDSTKEAFYKLKIMRLPEIYKFSALIFVYKFKNGLLPPVFEKIFLENRE